MALFRHRAHVYRFPLPRNPAEFPESSVAQQRGSTGCPRPATKRQSANKFCDSGCALCVSVFLQRQLPRDLWSRRWDCRRYRALLSPAPAAVFGRGCSAQIAFPETSLLVVLCPDIFGGRETADLCRVCRISASRKIQLPNPRSCPAHALKCGTHLLPRTKDRPTDRAHRRTARA